MLGFKIQIISKHILVTFIWINVCTELSSIFYIIKVGNIDIKS